MRGREETLKAYDILSAYFESIRELPTDGVCPYTADEFDTNILELRHCALDLIEYSSAPPSKTYFIVRYGVDERDVIVNSIANKIPVRSKACKVQCPDSGSLAFPDYMQYSFCQAVIGDLHSEDILDPTLPEKGYATGMYRIFVERMMKLGLTESQKAAYVGTLRGVIQQGLRKDFQIQTLPERYPYYYSNSKAKGGRRKKATRRFKRSKQRKSRRSRR